MLFMHIHCTYICMYSIHIYACTVYMYLLSECGSWYSE